MAGSLDTNPNSPTFGQLTGGSTRTDTNPTNPTNTYHPPSDPNSSGPGWYGGYTANGSGNGIAPVVNTPNIITGSDGTSFTRAPGDTGTGTQTSGPYASMASTTPTSVPSPTTVPTLGNPGGTSIPLSLSSAPADNIVNDLGQYLGARSDALNNDLSNLHYNYGQLAQQSAQRIAQSFGTQETALGMQQSQDTATQQAINAQTGRSNTSYGQGDLNYMQTLQNQKMSQLAVSEQSAIAEAQTALRNEEFTHSKEMIDVANQNFTQRQQLATLQQTQQKQNVDIAMQYANFGLQASQQGYQQNLDTNKFNLDAGQTDFKQKLDYANYLVNTKQITFQQGLDYSKYLQDQQRIKEEGNVVITDPRSGGNIVYDKLTNQWLVPGGITDPSTPGSTGLPGKGSIDDPQNKAWKDAYGKIADVLGTAAAQPIFRDLSQQLAQGDVQSARDTVSQGIKQMLPAAQQDQFYGSSQILGELGSIRNALNAYTSASGDTNIFKGTFEDLANKLGNTTDPKLAGLATQLQTLSTDWNHKQYGSRLTDTELTQSHTILPNKNNINSLNLSRLGTLINVINGEQKSAAKAALGSDTLYNKIFGDMDRPTSIAEFQASNPDVFNNEVAPLLQLHSNQADPSQDWTGAKALDYVLQKYYPQPAPTPTFNQPVSPGTNSSTSTSMRTDRNNNPTAFTTDVARVAGLQEGKDYVAGDPFSGGTTAKILGDPIATTIKAIDKMGFYTDSGKQRWTHTAIPKAQWDAMDYQEKKNLIKQMYQREGGTALKGLFS